MYTTERGSNKLVQLNTEYNCEHIPSDKALTHVVNVQSYDFLIKGQNASDISKSYLFIVIESQKFPLICIYNGHKGNN